VRQQRSRRIASLEPSIADEAPITIRVMLSDAVTRLGMENLPASFGKNCWIIEGRNVKKVVNCKSNVTSWKTIDRIDTVCA
jgi:hypothetical protein